MRKHARKRIMLVDDDTHLVVSLTDYFTSQGLEVIPALNGREALEKLEASAPDLILLDIGMPEMSGLTFLREISAPGGKLRYPVLIFTAKGAMESFFQDFAIEGFIAKPCSAHELLERVRAVLDRQSRQQPAERKKRRVLLAEDNERLAESLARYFEEHNYDVEVTYSGSQVMESASLAVPDVIVMKDSLPRVSGTTMAAMISSVPTLKYTPIVIYDSPAGTSQLRFFRGDLPPGVSKYLLTSDPAALVRAVDEVCAS